MKNQQELPTTLSRFFAAFQQQGGLSGIAEEIVKVHCDAERGVLGCMVAADAAESEVRKRLEATGQRVFLAALDYKEDTESPAGQTPRKEEMKEVQAQLKCAINDIAKKAKCLCQQMQAKAKPKQRITTIKSDARKKKSRRTDDEARHLGGAVKGNLQRQGHFQGSFAT